LRELSYVHNSVLVLLNVSKKGTEEYIMILNIYVGDVYTFCCKYWHKHGSLLSLEVLLYVVQYSPISYAVNHFIIQLMHTT